MTLNSSFSERQGSSTSPTSPLPSSTQRTSAIDSITPPTMTLRAFSERVGGLLKDGLPRSLWLQATVVSVRPGAYSHQLELADTGHEGSSTAQLRAFLPRATVVAIGKTLRSPFDPVLPTGMNTVLSIEPGFSARWHLEAKVVGLSPDATLSLEAARVSRLRQQLDAEKLYDRQRALRKPADVTRLAIIHPDGAAGWADIAGELSRWQAAGIVLIRSVPTPFDGDRAATALAAALDEASKPIAGAPPHLVLMVRGGGARSGWMMLDAESLVRAVGRCAIPIVAGLGHAVDRRLVDEVAWTAVDTPSKAIALVWTFINDPAMRAMADVGLMTEAALQQLAFADRALLAAHTRAITEAERRAAACATQLADLWSQVRVDVSGVSHRCRQLGADADRLMQDVLARAPDRIERAADAALDCTLELRAAIERRLAALDPGDALVAIVATRATALLDTQSVDIAGLIQAVLAAAVSRLRLTETDLGRTRESITAMGLEETLQRGFALVLDRDGHLIADRTAACTAGQIILQFGDGAGAAIVDASPATQDLKP